MMRWARSAAAAVGVAAPAVTDPLAPVLTGRDVHVVGVVEPEGVHRHDAATTAVGVVEELAGDPALVVGPPPGLSGLSGDADQAEREEYPDDAAQQPAAEVLA